MTKEKITTLLPLSRHNANLMKDIIKDEYLYNPKEAIKYTISDNADAENPIYYLKHYGKINTAFYGKLMYILGMKTLRQQ
jgi:hypothetical protein